MGCYVGIKWFDTISFVWNIYVFITSHRFESLHGLLNKEMSEHGLFDTIEGLQCHGLKPCESMQSYGMKPCKS